MGVFSSEPGQGGSLGSYFFIVSNREPVVIAYVGHIFDEKGPTNLWWL